jgi:hypothetical protein
MIPRTERANSPKVLKIGAEEVSDNDGVGDEVVDTSSSSSSRNSGALMDHEQLHGTRMGVGGHLPVH